MKEEDIEIIEKDNNISPKDSILAKEDLVKRRVDLSYFRMGKVKHIEVEFSFPERLRGDMDSYVWINVPESKKALKHQVEQFCFNNPGIEAKYTGYED